jgi:tetratricopeptide (TPR) repeat protein
MKTCFIIILTIGLSAIGLSQEKPNKQQAKLLEELAENACKCIDSIRAYTLSREETAKEISKCIDEQAGAFQMGSNLMNIGDLKSNAEEHDGKKQINISINADQNSREYKEYYFQMERYLMANCISIKSKIASSDKPGEKSVSENQQALEFYSKGLDESGKENYKNAIACFEKAVKADSLFAFAWDNLGICYRKLNDYDKALDAYKKSLEIDPKGIMPLQNIPIVYEYKQEYQNAIDAYGRLAEINKNDPEVYYGIGLIYALDLKDFEKGLKNICLAYNLYIQQKSPYRTDAEKVIGMIYSEMKKYGKEDRFHEILKENNINIQ